MLNNLFAKIGPGMARLTLNGKIAIKSGDSYKSYDVETGRLTNCDQFAMDIGTDLFFAVPAMKVKVGDNILVNGKPRCVIDPTDMNAIKVLSYDSNTIETIVPERHILFGNAFFFTKIVCLLGNGKGVKGMGKIMKFMMMSKLFGNDKGGDTNGMGNMAMMAMLMGGKDDFFGDLMENITGEIEDVGDDFDLLGDETGVEVPVAPRKAKKAKAKKEA